MEKSPQLLSLGSERQRRWTARCRFNLAASGWDQPILTFTDWSYLSSQRTRQVWTRNMSRCLTLYGTLYRFYFLTLVRQFPTFWLTIFFKVKTPVDRCSLKSDFYQDCDKSREGYHQGDVLNTHQTVQTWFSAGLTLSLLPAFITMCPHTVTRMQISSENDGRKSTEKQMLVLQRRGNWKPFSRRVSPFILSVLVLNLDQGQRGLKLLVLAGAGFENRAR